MILVKHFWAWVKSVCFQTLKCFALTVLLVTGLSNYCQNEALANDVQLVMFTSKDCPACQSWEKKIGVVYKKSQYQIALPLKRVIVSHPVPDWISIQQPIRGTPTFIITENGQEVGRITGFKDPEMFWWQLSSFIE